VYRATRAPIWQQTNTAMHAPQQCAPAANTAPNAPRDQCGMPGAQSARPLLSQQDRSAGQKTDRAPLSARTRRSLSSSTAPPTAPNAHSNVRTAAMRAPSAMPRQIPSARNAAWSRRGCFLSGRGVAISDAWMDSSGTARIV